MSSLTQIPTSIPKSEPSPQKNVAPVTLYSPSRFLSSKSDTSSPKLIYIVRLALKYIPNTNHTFSPLSKPGKEINSLMSWMLPHTVMMSWWIMLIVFSICGKKAILLTFSFSCKLTALVAGASMLIHSTMYFLGLLACSKELSTRSSWVKSIILEIWLSLLVPCRKRSFSC